MNIGEISKPSADRSQLKKKLAVRATDPVTPTQAVSDLVELSDESRHKFDQEQAKSSRKKNKHDLVSEDDQSERTSHIIDIEI